MTIPLQLTNEIYFLGQIFLAVILGGLLGIQREKRGKHAGPRTYALVTAGAALFTVLSLNAFGVEIASVAAPIVVGIGFLGAGTIMHQQTKVEGLTTAAGFWMTAAIGMTVGVGYYFLAIGTTILILFVLMFNDNRFKNCQEGEEE